MSQNRLELIVHVTRKVLLRSSTRAQEVTSLPPFRKWDEVALAITLVNDAEVQSASTPFEIIDPEGLNLRVAIGNALSGSSRRLLAQSVTFVREGTAFVGELSLATAQVASYLTFPDPWVNQPYGEGSEVYDSGRYYRVTKAIQAATGKRPELDTTHWREFQLSREDLFFEITLIRRDGPEVVLKMPCVVEQPVNEVPVVPPDLIEDPIPFQNALAAAVGDSKTVFFTRTTDLADADRSPAPEWVQGAAYPYLERVVRSDVKRYYQAVRPIKLPVRVRSAVNVDIDSPGATHDSVVMTGGNRILLTAQTFAEENGIYEFKPTGANRVPLGAVFTSLAGASVYLVSAALTNGKLYWWNGKANALIYKTPAGATLTLPGYVNGVPTPAYFIGTSTATSGPLISGHGSSTSAVGQPVQAEIREVGLVRAGDLDDPSEFLAGLAIPVSEGTAGAGQRWALTTNEAVEIDVTELTFAQLTGSGPIVTTDAKFWAQALGTYPSTSWDVDHAYLVGEQFIYQGRHYHTHTDAPAGTLPLNKGYFGELIPFDPSQMLYANAKVRTAAQGGAMYVHPKFGIDVDPRRVIPRTYTVDSQVDQDALLASGNLKLGDYIVRSDLGDSKWQVIEIPEVGLPVLEEVERSREPGAGTVATLERSRVGNVAKVKLVAPHGLITGNKIAMAGLGGVNYNVTEVTITRVDDDELTYPAEGPDEAVVSDTGGAMTKLIPVFNETTSIGRDLPASSSEVSAGSPGQKGEAAAVDHQHPAALATADADGLYPAEHFRIVAALGNGGGGAGAGGFNGIVRALARSADGKVFVGGEFTKYGSADVPRLAKIGADGTLDAHFAVGTGFNTPVQHLAVSEDGDLYVAANWQSQQATPLKYRGAGSAGANRVWRLDGSTAEPLAYTTPSPVASVGADNLIGLAVSGAHVALLTPQTLRCTDLDGTDELVKTGTANFHGIIRGWDAGTVLVSSSAYISSALATGQSYDGHTDPKGLKLIDLADGSIVGDWSTGGGTGSNAAMGGMARFDGVSIAESFVIVANRPFNDTTYFGTDGEWNGNNALQFRGLAKLRSDGAGSDEWWSHITWDLTAPANSPFLVPFFVDSQGRTYFGGAVLTINTDPSTGSGDTTVTEQWTVYRLKPDGSFDREFSAFSGPVYCGLLLNDDLMVFGGNFDQYGTRTGIGNIAFLNSNGDLVIGPGVVPEENVGKLVVVDTLPDNAIFDTEPRNRLNGYVLTNKVGSGRRYPKLYLYSYQDGGLIDMCTACDAEERILPQVQFSPAAGTAIPGGGSLDVVLSVEGHAVAAIRYTVDGTEPNSGSPLYSGPINVASPTTIKAFAHEVGWRDSDVAVAQYDTGAMSQLDPPTFDPPTGTPLPVTLEINHVTPGVTIRYTLNGTEPNSSSPVYSTPLSLSQYTMVKAIAFKSGWVPSEVAEALYEPVEQLVPPSLNVQVEADGAVLVWMYDQPGWPIGVRVYYTWDPDENPTPDKIIRSSELTPATATFLEDRVDPRNGKQVRTIAVRAYAENFLPSEIVKVSVWKPDRVTP